MKFIISPSKVIFNSVIAVLFGVLGIYSFALQFWGLATIFTVLTLGYACVAIFYSGSISLDETGVTCAYLGKTVRHQAWQDIREILIIGTRIGALSGKYPGAMFICFLAEKQTEDSRFKLALGWPHLKLSCLRYSDSTLAAVREYWAEEIKTCNIGREQIDTKAK